MGEEFSYKLAAGTLLQNRYRIDSVLGEGGFGITYKAYDTLLEIRVAIKEYYPNRLAIRDASITPHVTITESKKNADVYMHWKERFLQEARVLAQCSNIPYIVSALNFFEENDTAYIVMEFLDGKTLTRIVEENGTMDGRELAELIVPLLGSLDKIHKNNLLHRDISPDNIMLMPDNTLKLFDFGAARSYEINSQKSMSVVLKHGYAPPEQYRTHGEQGPWTDIYAMCATLYFCLTGSKPENSIDRMMDNGKITRPSQCGRTTPVDSEFEDIILKGMNINYEDRYMSAKLMQNAIIEYLNGNQNNTVDSSTVSKTVLIDPSGSKYTKKSTENQNDKKPDQDKTSVEVYHDNNSNEPTDNSIHDETDTPKGKKKKWVLVCALIIVILSAAGYGTFKLLSHESSTEILEVTASPAVADVTSELSITETSESIATATVAPTETPEQTATATVAPTETPEQTATATPAPTETPEQTATATPAPTETPEPTATATPVPTPTVAPTATPIEFIPTVSGELLVRAKKAGVYIYREPDASSKLMAVSTTKNYEIVGMSDEWYKVKIAGKDDAYYVRSSEFDVFDAPTATPSPTATPGVTPSPTATEPPKQTETAAPTVTHSATATPKAAVTKTQTVAITATATVKATAVPTPTETLSPTPTVAPTPKKVVLEPVEREMLATVNKSKVTLYKAPNPEQPYPVPAVSGVSFEVLAMGDGWLKLQALDSKTILYAQTDGFTITPKPTATPTVVPTTKAPTATPKTTPTTKAPTATPKTTPTTKAPTATPKTTPTTKAPTATPKTTPTTKAPTATPKAAPTTKAPTATPTKVITKAPTATPKTTPTTKAPTATPKVTPTAKAPMATAIPISQNKVWICVCGTENSGDDRFCESCGNPKPAEKAASWTCSCGQENTDENMFCESCGNPKPAEKAASWTCSCGQENADDDKFCLECGLTKEKAIKGVWICVKCRNENSADDMFCSECGERRSDK